MLSMKPGAALLALFGLVLLFAPPALAFGAGNIAGISKVEGQNWRHGDIEDTLLAILIARAVGGKKFDKLNVSRVYFGNWLRDYSQAIDVGTVKSVSAEAIRLLLCVLGFLSFGYGSKEFEVTADRLGCYRPEDHIDNPKNYADNVDARQYDRRLRGPVDEEVELGIDERTGLKNYIANEQANIMTAALHVRRLFSRCIELGRSYAQRNDKREFHEALRLMGTGLHCLEDFLAHSNYVELALIEMGERNVFPHVGSDTQMRLHGARHKVYPCVTGTFGGVDFLHSVCGEVSDKLTQNEVDELDSVLQNSQRNDTSIIEGLLDKIPDGILGGDDKKGKMQEIQSNAQNAQMQNMSVSPRDPEEFTQYIDQVYKQIMPAIELHDEIMKSIAKTMEKIPVLPDLIEQLEDQMSIWVFSVMAPFVVPIIDQVKNELRTGSNEIISSSENEQHIVFNDDRSTDPTHSMLSKDHFSNILNEIAGKTASQVLKWVVPQIMQAWDDESVDVERLMNRIIHGVLHHPAQREMGDDGARDGRQIMFRSVEQWWSEMDEGQKDEYRRKLSREGVENGENHREGIHDSGHGCGKPLGMHKNFAQGGSFENQIAGQAAGAIAGGITQGISDFVQGSTGVQLPSTQSGGNAYGQETSGGLGGLLSSVGGSLLSGFTNQEKESHSSRREDDNSYTETRTEYGHSGDRYEQAEVSRTQYSDGGETDTYRRYEQDEDRGGNTTSYGFEERIETRPAYGGGRQEERIEERWESREESSGYERPPPPRGGFGNDDFDRRDEGYGRERREQYERREERDEGYGRRDDFERRPPPPREEDFGGYGGREEGFERRRDDDYERRDDYGRRDEFGRESRDNDRGDGGFIGNVMDAVQEGFDGRRRERRGDDDDYEQRRGGW